MTKSSYLDRDGVINVDDGYIGSLGDLNILVIWGLLDFCAELKYDALIVTNQSGVARGFLTKKQLKGSTTKFDLISKLQM